jgi:hypothetical protein
VRLAETMTVARHTPGGESTSGPCPQARAVIGFRYENARPTREIAAGSSAETQVGRDEDPAVWSRPYFDQSSGFGSVYSPITVPSTASICTNPRIVGGDSAL